MVAKSGNFSVELTWNNPSDIDFDHVEIIATPTDTTLETVIVVTNNDSSSYTVRGLYNDKEYTFIVKAIDTSGNKSEGCTGVTATPLDSIAPSNVTSMFAKSGNSLVELTWNNPTDSDFDHVVIIATPTDTTEETVTVKTSNKTTKTYTVSGLTNDKEYTFIVKAIDTSGNKSEGCVGVTATPLDSIAPSNVTSILAKSGNSSVELTWVNPTDSDFDHVEIIATPTDKTLETFTVEISKKTTETYTVRGLYNDKEYTFVIKAIDTSGNKSEGCVGVKATTLDTIAPSEVINLTSMEVSTGTAISLSWTNPTDSDFDHVEIIANPTDSTEDTVTVETVDSTINSYIVTGLSNGKEYTFVIKAIDTSGNNSEGCSGVTLRTYGTSTGINPPNWIKGLWSGVATNDESSDTSNFSCEFSNDDMIVKEYGIEMSYKGILEMQPNMMHITSISSTTSSTTYKVNMEYSDRSSLEIVFTKTSDTTLTIFQGTYCGTFILGQEFVYETDSSVNITPPDWIIGSWSGYFAGEEEYSIPAYNVTYKFTTDDMLYIIEDAMVKSFKYCGISDSYIIGVSSSYTDTTFTVTIVSSSIFSWETNSTSSKVYTFTKNADDTLTTTEEESIIILSKD